MMTLATMSADAHSDLRLSSAILLYGNHRGKAPGFATIHDIMEGPNDRPTIGAGKPLTSEALELALTALAESNHLQTWRFVDESVLASGPSLLAWWTPAQTRHVFFDARTGLKSGPVAQPAQFWVAQRGRLHVYSLGDSMRPTPDTPVFNPIHYNVYSGGNVCLGSTVVPHEATPAAWTDAFYASVFTHPNSGTSFQTTMRGGVTALWKKLLREGGKSNFPSDKLRPSGLTVAQVLEKVAQ